MMQASKQITIKKIIIEKGVVKIGDNFYIYIYILYFLFNAFMLIRCGKSVVD